MVIKFARIRFEDETTKYFIKPITAIKENESDDDEKHITPAHENDFDAKHTYYCQFMLCKDNCLENHKHFEYYPCRVFLLGESIEIINQKIKQKRCAIPKLPSDLGGLRSTKNESVLKEKVKEPNKKILKLNVKRNRSQAILNALANTFVDHSDDSNSECSQTSNHSKQSHKVTPVSVRVQKLSTYTPSQPSTSQHSENVGNNFPHDAHIDDESNCSLPTNMKEAALSEPPLKKSKRAPSQRTQNRLSSGLIDTSALTRESPVSIRSEDYQPNISDHDSENPAAEDVIDSTQNNDEHVRTKDSTKNGEAFEDNFVTKDNRDADATKNNTIRNHQTADNNDKGIEGQNMNSNKDNQNPIEEIHAEEIDSDNEEENNVQGQREDNDVQEQHDENNENNEANGHDRRRKEIKMKDFVLKCIKYYKAPEGHGFEERQRRYSVADGEIYLGENISVKSLEWDMANLERPAIFLTLVAQMLWHPHDLVNRALEVTTDMRNIPARSPIKIIEKDRLRLLISLYHDYLKKDKCMDNLTRANYLLKATYHLRTKIKNLRTQEIKARTPNNVRNARRRLKYNID